MVNHGCRGALRDSRLIKRLLMVLGVLVAAGLVAARGRAGSRAESQKVPVLYVRDGQSVHGPFEVFIDQELPLDSKPELELQTRREVQGLGSVGGRTKATHIFPNQLRNVTIAGESHSIAGTVLLFEPRVEVPFYKPAIRVTPVLTWSIPGSPSRVVPARRAKADALAEQRRVTVVENDVLLGNPLGAALWTAMTLVVLGFFVCMCTSSLARRITSFEARPALLLLTGPSGYLSLAQTQVVVWTMAVGCLVFMYGLLRLSVPEIPESLVALMGMSLLTGLAGKFSGQVTRPGSSPVGSSEPPPSPASTLPASPAAAAAAAVAAAAGPASAPLSSSGASYSVAPFSSSRRARARLADLVSTWNERTGEPVLSLPKAQMVFWTAIVVLLFLVKTLYGETLWSVPWEMVALTGFSQFGYLGDKFVSSRPRSTANAGAWRG